MSSSSEKLEKQLENALSQIAKLTQQVDDLTRRVKSIEDSSSVSATDREREWIAVEKSPPRPSEPTPAAGVSDDSDGDDNEF